MMKIRNNMTILIVEDDPDDQLLATEAIKKSAPIKKLEFVEDGEQLIDYLLRREKYKFLEGYPFPHLIILDLNMPKIDGRQALKEIRKHPQLRKIPIVVLTTSVREEDIVNAYELGVSSYIAKPASFAELSDMMKTLLKYWTDVVELPDKDGEFRE